jgi:hypothetical protein
LQNHFLRCKNNILGCFLLLNSKLVWSVFMTKKLTRRGFFSKGAKLVGLSAAFGAGLLADVKLNGKDGIKIAKGIKLDLGVSEAAAKCGQGYNCSGGGGQCGQGYNCSGGGGQCGQGYNCSGR